MVGDADIIGTAALASWLLCPLLSDFGKFRLSGLLVDHAATISALLQAIELDRVEEVALSRHEISTLTQPQRMNGLMWYLHPGKKIPINFPGFFFGRTRCFGGCSVIMNKLKFYACT